MILTLNPQMKNACSLVVCDENALARQCAAWVAVHEVRAKVNPRRRVCCRCYLKKIPKASTVLGSCTHAASTGPSQGEYDSPPDHRKRAFELEKAPSKFTQQLIHSVESTAATSSVAPHTRRRCRSSACSRPTQRRRSSFDRRR